MATLQTSRLISVRLTLAVLLATASLGGCRNPVVCSPELDLYLYYSPQDTTVTVGSAFQAKLTLRGCPEGPALNKHTTFASSSPAVLSVHPTNGLASAKAPGQADLTMKGVEYPGAVSVHVTVVAP